MVGKFMPRLSHPGRHQCVAGPVTAAAKVVSVFTAATCVVGPVTTADSVVGSVNECGRTGHHRRQCSVRLGSGAGPMWRLALTELAVS